MNPDTLIWIALPQRLAVAADGSAALHLAIAVQPRLQSATTGAAGLAAWPPAPLGGATLQVDLGPTGATARALDGTARVEADPALWPLMFPPDTPVAAATDGAGDARPLEVEPTATQARAARELFEAAAAVPVATDDDPGVARAALDAAVGKAIAASPLAREARLAPARARAVAVRAGAMRGGGRAAAAHEAADPPPPLQQDFHRTVALLREHPVVMRALGLVFDVAVAVPAATALAEVGVVRVRWPDAPPGLPAIVSPWTAYELDVETGKFLPQSRDVVSAGMLAISDATDADGAPAWSLATLDVDLAVDRIGHAADGMARARGAAPDGQAPALPTFRTDGIALLHGARTDQLAARRGRRAAQRAVDPAEMILHADDLVLGYRIDVRRGDGAWRSLCTRLATYTLAGGRGVGPAGAPEEGNVKAHAAIDDGDGNALHTDEVVARWRGWSLAVTPPRFDGDGGGSTPAAGSGRLTWSYALPPRALPRLRFAGKYQLRARIADLAGGGLGVDDVLADRCASASTIYERYEPVLAPAVTLPAAVDPLALGPGESAEQVVLRSDRDVTPARFAAAHPELPVSLQRAFESPRVPLALVEQHGALDRITDPAASWAIVREAVAPADPAHPLPLPDPAAAGIAAFHPSTLGAPRQLRTIGWPGSPGVRPKRVRLTAGRRGDAPTMQWIPTADADELVVRLAPGHALAVEVSSTMQEGFSDQFAARQFLTDDAKLAAADGRHPLLTPARTVRLVHAVRKPLADPAGAFTAAREPGATFAVLVPTPAILGLDAPSTAQVDLTAAWTEFTDDRQTPVAGVRVGGAALAAEGTTFVDPIHHAFGDTRYRVVTYTATAVSRHRSLFDPTGTADDGLFTKTVTFAPAHVPSAAPPAAPVVLATVPAFRWTDVTDAAPADGPAGGRVLVARRRRESLLRVVLDRPWFSSGEGEQLAVIIAAHWPVDEAHRAVVTEVGRDPLWAAEVPPRWPGEGDFGGAAGDAVPVHLATPGVDVLALPYAVWYAAGRWHADVRLAMTPSSYSPLVRLAVARYQPHSVVGAALSPIVQTPFAPLLPDRLLTVERAGDTLYVRLEGAASGGPKGTTISAVLERCPEATPQGLDLSSLDLSADADRATRLLWRPVDMAADWTRDGQRFGQELAIAIPARSGPLRLVVRETEPLASGDAGLVPASGMERRVVFLDVVPIASA